MIDRADIQWAYRLFLCREPDEQYLEGFLARLRTREEVRDAFARSDEFGNYLGAQGFVRADIVRCVDRAGESFFINNAFLPALASFLDGSYQRHVTSALNRILRPGDVFIDIGASVGWFSLIAARLVGDAGKVYAYEPHGTTFEAMRRSIEARGLAHIVSPVRLALSDKCSMAYVALPLQQDGRGAHLSPMQRNLERVPTSSLDDILFSGSITLIKISTNGNEQDILKGATQTLQKHRPHLAMTRASVRRNDGLLAELGYRGVPGAIGEGDETELIILDPNLART